MIADYLFLVGLVIAYLLGSIPTSLWFGKFYYGIDIREHGSGNAGATNALRVLGVKAGIFVLVVDFLKGVAAVAFAGLFKHYFESPEQFVLFQLIMGVVAFAGHMFPVFANFKGGKGVATMAGVISAIFPFVFLICLGVFTLVFIPSRYVSLGSLAAAIAFPLFVIFVFDTELISKIIFSLLTAIILIFAHRNNIKRLVKGNENKIKF